jgi:hypothetical protein
VLEEKLNLLHALSLRASSDSSAVVEGYRRTLQDYLQKRLKGGSSAVKGNNSPATQLLLKDTLKKLDELDAHVTGLRGQTNAPAPELTHLRK